MKKGCLKLIITNIIILTFPGTVLTQPFGFSPTSALNTNAATGSGHDWSPEVTADGNGNWIAVWDSYDSLGSTVGTDTDIFVTSSLDEGITWTNPAALNSTASTDHSSLSDLRPKVVTDGNGKWVAVWDSQNDLAGTIGSDWDILTAQSTDNGASWTTAAAFNENAATGAWTDWKPRLCTDGSGNWVAVWESLDSLTGSYNANWNILVAYSNNNATTWSFPTVLNSSSRSGHDHDPFIETDGAGNWIVAWYSWNSLSGTIGTDEDILISRSSNNGASWSNPTALNINAINDSGDDYSPELATDGNGNWVAVWASDDDLGGTIGSDFDLLVASSADNGITWSLPALLNITGTTDTGRDIRPKLRTDGNNDWVVVWYSDDDLGSTVGSDFDIHISRSTDLGITWTTPVALNSLASTDSSTEQRPHLATDGNGLWVASWMSNDPLGGTVGTDYDLHFSLSLNLPVDVSLMLLE